MRKGALTIAITMTAAACDYGPQPVPPPPVPSQADCPDGFGPLGGGLDDGCYLVVEDGDWVAGEERCEEHESLGEMAHLIVVDREVEHLALNEMVWGTYGIWLGRMQMAPDEDYRNINYVDADREYFSAGEPNDYGQDCDGWDWDCDERAGYGDERCIEYSDTTGMWNDEVCADVQMVICEWDSVGPYGWRPHDDD